MVLPFWHSVSGGRCPLRRVITVALVLGLLAAGCGGSSTPAPPASATAAASAKPSPVALKVSYSNTIGDYLPLFIAKDAGIFAENGIETDPVMIASAQGIAAVVSGEVNVAMLGGSEILSAAAQGADLVIVAVIGNTYPFIFEAAPGIKTPADLKGKKIGVSTIGSSSDIATRVALRKLGIDPEKDVTIVAVGSADQRTAAMLSGAIQGGVTLVPDNLVVEEKGFTPLFNLAELKLPAAQTVVTMQRSFLTSRRDLAQRVVDSIVLAIVREQKDRPFAIATLKKWLKVDDQKKLDATYDFYAKSFHTPLPYPKAEQFADSKTQLGATNAKVRDYDLSKLLDESLVKSAADRGLDKK